MSNKGFSAYFDFPINPRYLYINCSVCGMNYGSSDYAKELMNGDPTYFLLENGVHVHFCGASCVSKKLHAVE